MDNFKKLLDHADKMAEETFVAAIIDELYDKSLDNRKMFVDNSFDFMVRNSYNQKFSWPLLTEGLISRIQQFLQGKKCLSVMSGKGYLEYFLYIKNCDIIATDIKGNDEVNSFHTIKMNSLFKVIHDHCGMSGPKRFRALRSFDVIECDAIKAVTKYHDRDVLLMSWPNYMNSIGEKTLEFALQVGIKYIIYIGEGDGGCCATDEFFEILQEKTIAIQDIKMSRFAGIWDNCTVYESKLISVSSDIKYRSPLLNKRIHSFVRNNASLKNKGLKKLIKKHFGVQLTQKHLNFMRELI